MADIQSQSGEIGADESGQSIPRAREDSDEASWARPMGRLQTDGSQEDAFSVNLDGKQVVSPMQGFGQLWQRTYQVRLTGVDTSAEAVMAKWKAHFPEYQPPENRFYPSATGVKPGELVYIDSNLMSGPGVSQMTEIASGVVVIYADDVSFTVMTPQGFPVAGWNTFSAFEDDGRVVAQVQGLERAADPLYEFGYRFLGGERKQDRTWIHVLRSLAASYGVKAEVQHWKSLVDPKLQWANAGNLRHNAALRTLAYRIATPIRWLRG